LSHRLEYFEHNFTASARADPNMGDLVNGNTPKLGWNRGGVTQEYKNRQYL